jgi:hypothetical protein
MSNSIGETNGSTTATGGATPSAADIFAAEVQAIKAEEEAGGRDPFASGPSGSGSDEGSGPSLSSVGPGDAETGGDLAEGDAGTQEPAATVEGADASGEAGENEGDETGGDDLKKRNNWKKEALERKQELDELKAEMAEIKQMFSQKATDLTKLELPKFDKNDPNLSQELKDLLEYTPGLDTMLSSLAAKAAEAILEKKEAEKVVMTQQQAEAQKQQETDKKYWSSMESWISGQYPELSLSDIRNSPDFKDWLNLRKTWVDTQLSSSSYDDISGAQKVFERYIKENNLGGAPAQEQEGRRNLAAARTPPANRRTTPPVQAQKSLFQEEAQRISQSRRNYTI